MANDISARQAVLKKIWNSKGHRDVWILMANDSAARAADIGPELFKEAEVCRQFNVDLAGRLEEMGNEVNRIHACVDQFAAVKTMADLTAVYQSCDYAYFDKFHQILGGFWTDARANGDQQRIDNLRRGMRLLRDINVTVDVVTSLKDGEEELWSERVKSNPLACDKNFHEFLDGKALFAARQHHSSAEGVAVIATQLRYFCRAIEAIAGAVPSDRKGFKNVIRPSKPEEAELWFTFSKEFSELSLELTKKINEKGLRLEDAIATILQFVRRGEENEETADIFFISAFLEHLLLEGNAASRVVALEHYRDLLTMGSWSRKDAEATFMLRYAKAVLNHWRYVSDQQERLQQTADLVGETLPSVDPEKSPRLTRDLWFWRARLLENVGIWRADAYEEAADAYQRGLDVANIKFELEARGMAMTDYGNTLTRLHREDEAALDKKIIATFEESLSIFRAEKRILGGTLARNSYAVYLNERAFGNRLDNQEKALSLVQEAIGIIEGDTEEYDSNNDYLRRTIAGPYLTMSNIFLKREVGDEATNHESAIKALHSAWNKLGAAEDDQLRGIIKLNIGHAEIALYGMTGQEAHALNAMYSYQEAEGLLEKYPFEYSQAVLGSAMLVAEVPKYSTPEAIEESLASTRRALALTEQGGDAAADARAQACLGELLLLRNSEGDLTEAVDCLMESRDTFYALGTTENAISASQRVALVHMKSFEKTQSLDDLSAAKEALNLAATWVDELWEQINSVDWRHQISDRYSDIYADIAWCQAALREPFEDLISTIARSKGREFVAHAREIHASDDAGESLREYADQLRVDSRTAERRRWQASRNVRPEAPLDEVMLAARVEMRSIELARRLIFPRPRPENEPSVFDRIQAFLKTRPKTVIFDITLSRWGTVALVFGGSDTPWRGGPETLVLSLRSGQMGRWLASYSNYLRTPAPNRDGLRTAWAEETDRLIEFLGQQLMQPCLAKFGELPDGSELVIAAGRLAGMPLHAVRLADGRFVAEAFEVVEYIPNLSVLSPMPEESTLPASALCVVSDPFDDLPMTAAEGAEVARSLAGAGTKVTLLARSGREVGASAFARRGVAVDQEVDVQGATPTPTQVAKLMEDKDHFFYTGHGTRRDTQSGLVLVTDDGTEALLAEDEILSMPALRKKPVVVLSACETARSEQGSSELFDVASCFLRVGARYVLGSLWVVRGDYATAFSESFYKHLLSGASPNRAYGQAIRALLKFRSADAGKYAVPPDHPIYWSPFVALRGE
jgi:CHAT domain